MPLRKKIMESEGTNKRLGNILAVEDDPIDTLVVRALLDKHFNVHIVDNGPEALALMNEIKFDIILADINLGSHEMDGVALMKLIRANEQHKTIKVFAVTSYYENRGYFIEQGFDELLTKPVIKEEILDILNASISSSSVAD